MPSDMRLQCPSEDTPPSTRPPSVASSGGTSGTPHRSTSMDSLHTNSSVSDKPTGEEFIPTRLVRALPKANANAMQFVKTGPAMLHKSAKEQMKKAEVVKSLRKTSLQEQEEEEWQKKSSTPPVTNLKSFGDDDTDWQSNLDKWKSNRRKRNEDVLERVIEVKKNELDDEFSRRRSAIREDKNRKGRRYNMLVVHDDDSNDLSDLLGFTSTTKETTGTSLNTRSTGDSHHPSTVEEGEANKSDAGFCTGSSDDTGSDGGVFAEDNISDTSSALGDKREVHDSLLDSGSSSAQRKEDSSCDELIINGHHHVNGTMTTTSAKVANAVIVGGKGGEYTYDKAIEDYRQFAENSVKKRTSSVTSLSSNASGSKDDQDNNNIKSSSSSPIGKKIEDKLSYFDGGGVAAKEPRVVKRDKTTAKIDIDKRRSMFELRDIDKQQRQDNSLTNSYTRRPDLYYRRSVDANSNTGSVQSLRNKVASFENISASSIDLRHKGSSATPVRDSKFKEKLANFSQIEKGDVGGGVSPTRRKTPQKDQNFYEKLKNFTQIEATNGGRDGRGGSLPRNLSPEQCYPPNSAKKTLSMRLSSAEYRRGSNAPAPMPLKDRIASFENLAPAGAPSSSVGSRKEFSVSMENLNKGSWGAGGHTLQSSQSATNLFRRSAPPPSTPFMVVEVDEEAAATSTTTTTTSTSAEEETCVKRTITRSYDIKNTIENLESKEKKNGDSPLSIKKVPPPPPPLPEKHRSRALPETPASRDTSPAGSRARILPEVPSKTSYEVPLSRSLPGTPSVSKPLLDFPKPRTLPETPMPRRESPRLLPETPRTQPDILEMNSEISPIGESSKSNEGSVLDRLPDLAPPSPTPPPSGLPPPIPPPSVPSYEEDKSLEAPSLEKTDCLYGDQDIDEVIGNCPSLPDFSTKSDPNNLNPSVPSNERNTEISSYAFEELPANDSGFEVPKKEDPPVMKGDSSNQQVRKTPDSPSPSKDSIANNNFPVLEVLDVTWTEDKSSSPALPPSVPPPPPPPEEEEEEGEGEERCNDVGADDQTLTKAAVTPLLSPTAVATEKEAWKATSSPLSSPQTTKQELRKRMSDFLGTQPKAEEAMTLQPPPDLSELLRQERDAERQIVQKQQQLYLSRDSPVPDSSLHSCLGSPLSPTRPKYTWEDRMKADDTKTGRHDGLNESSDTLEFHTVSTAPHHSAI